MAEGLQGRPVPFCLVGNVLGERLYKLQELRERDYTYTSYQKIYIF
jgi:hypothetical protein